ncbi:hypothetical protein BVC80_8349g9 [Macleaya cordata]|uniref:Uncharacterized protein n=1 Tax=Macleaya cordata TaxID=56857 RepID=A0A200QAZ5_MACCD|nr:hypothetical protein BVC80_8349g9 [Macleaya cordata]
MGIFNGVLSKFIGIEDYFLGRVGADQILVSDAMFKSWWSNLDYEGRPSYTLAKKLQDLKFMIKSWSKDTFGNSNYKSEMLTELVENVDNKEEVYNLSS